MVRSTYTAIIAALDREPQHSELKRDLVDFELFFVRLMADNVFIDDFGVDLIKCRLVEIGLRLALLLHSLLLHELRLIRFGALWRDTTFFLKDHDTGNRWSVLDFSYFALSSFIKHQLFGCSSSLMLGLETFEL